MAQDFSLAAKEEAIEAIGIGEQMLELMDRLGFSPSVTWPGYLRLTELLLKVRVRFHEKEKKRKIPFTSILSSSFSADFLAPYRQKT